jgi:hypothetical protein
MQVTHARESENARSDSIIRGGQREFLTLLTGEEGSPGNYKLSFVRQTGALDIPRHRHNFDQIRMCLEGERQNYGKGKWIAPGELVYFPEGTPYGPEQSTSRRLSITLQFGGASGSGYIGAKRIAAAMDEMREFGAFEKGVFSRTGELAPRQRRNQDSYEAIWEHINGRKLVYPKQRYAEPILMKPANFAWLPAPGQDGFALKRLAVVSERGAEIAMARVEDGATGTIAPRSSTTVGFVTLGEGEVNGNEVSRHSAFAVPAGEACRLSGSGAMEMLLVGLPVLA